MCHSDESRPPAPPIVRGVGHQGNLTLTASDGNILLAYGDPGLHRSLRRRGRGRLSAARSSAPTAAMGLRRTPSNMIGIEVLGSWSERQENSLAVLNDR